MCARISLKVVPLCHDDSKNSNKANIKTYIITSCIPILKRFGVIILNTGGTFNKIYDPIKGELVVPRDNKAVEDILERIHLAIPVRGLIYKDSLDFDRNDRAALLEAIVQSRQDVVVVHGTDTMDLSAAFVASHVEDRCIVFTGSMVPYSIDGSEASANLMLAIAKVRYSPTPGVYIAMHGIVDRYDRVVKNRQRGVFESQV